LKSIIDGHNKIQSNQNPDEFMSCNCRNKSKCPLQGSCRQSSLVYQATVEPTDGTDIKTEKYVGLTDTEFKLRLANHKQSFNKHNLRNATELSKYVWSLKDKKVAYEIKWKVLGKARAYSNKTKKCNLCTLEKYFILCQPQEATLNQKCGLVSSCRHSGKFLLGNHPT
jgi:hypothetical protein